MNDAIPAGGVARNPHGFVKELSGFRLRLQQLGAIEAVAAQFCRRGKKFRPFLSKAPDLLIVAAIVAALEGHFRIVLQPSARRYVLVNHAQRSRATGKDCGTLVRLTSLYGNGMD